MVAGGFISFASVNVIIAAFHVTGKDDTAGGREYNNLNC
jgi:hypothetical protein